jgi:hypothetical protein
MGKVPVAMMKRDGDENANLARGFRVSYDGLGGVN